MEIERHERLTRIYEMGKTHEWQQKVQLDYKLYRYCNKCLKVMAELEAL